MITVKMGERDLDEGTLVSARFYQAMPSGILAKWASPFTVCIDALSSSSACLVALGNEIVEFVFEKEISGKCRDRCNQTPQSR